MPETCSNCHSSVTDADVTCPVCGELLTRRISSDLRLDQTGEVPARLERDPALDDSGGAHLAPVPEVAKEQVEDDIEPELEMLEIEDLVIEPEDRVETDAAMAEPAGELEVIVHEPASAPPAPPIPTVRPRLSAREEPEHQPRQEIPIQPSPPLPPPAPQEPVRDTAAMHKTQVIEETDLPGILNHCTFLAESGYNLVGLFGRPETGKSSFLYALREHFKRGTAGFGGFTTETEAWDRLARELEEQWETRRYQGTRRALHLYKAKSPKKKNHLCILDIAGEQFENVKTWSGEVFDFFGLYLARCKGFFILVELDENIVNHTGYGAAERRSRQMEQIIAFLSVAATVDRIATLDDLEGKRKAVTEASKRDGKSKVSVPVVICLSKADRIPSMNFGSVYGRIVPGDGSYMGDPWNVVKTFWREHYESLLNLVPHLKIEWLSCLGSDFEQQHRFSGSMGLRAAFEHVVVKPPPKWAMSARTLMKYRKLLRI